MNFTAPAATSGPTALWIREMPSLPKPAQSFTVVQCLVIISFAASSAWEWFEQPTTFVLIAPSITA